MGFFFENCVHWAHFDDFVFELAEEVILVVEGILNFLELLHQFTINTFIIIIRPRRPAVTRRQFFIFSVRDHVKLAFEIDGIGLLALWRIVHNFEIVWYFAWNIFEFRIDLSQIQFSVHGYYLRWFIVFIPFKRGFPLQNRRCRRFRFGSLRCSHL